MPFAISTQQCSEVLVALPTLGNVGLWKYSHSSGYEAASHVVGLCFQRVFCWVYNCRVPLFSFSTEAVISRLLACLVSVKKSAAALNSVPQHAMVSLSLHVSILNVIGLGGHSLWVCICMCVCVIIFLLRTYPASWVC